MISETPRCLYIKSSKNHISGCVTAHNVILNSVCIPQSTTSTALKWLDRLLEWGSPRLKFYTNIHPQTINFRGTARTITRSQSFRFLSMGTKTLMYSEPIEMKGFFTNSFLLPRQTTATAPGLLKGRWVHNQTCPCMHWLRWRTCCMFVVNCDLMNSKELSSC